jgi:hypothetical protein
MLRVVSHDRPIALANTSSDCELVSRVSYSIAAVGRFDIARRRWATAAAPPAICFGPACYIGGNIGGAWTNVSVTDNFTGSEVSRNNGGFTGGGQINCDYQLAGAWVSHWVDGWRRASGNFRCACRSGRRKPRSRSKIRGAR